MRRSQLRRRRRSERNQTKVGLKPNVSFLERSGGRERNQTKVGLKQLWILTKRISLLRKKSDQGGIET